MANTCGECGREFYKPRGKYMHQRRSGHVDTPAVAVSVLSEARATVLAAVDKINLRLKELEDEILRLHSLDEERVELVAQRARFLQSVEQVP